MICSYFNQPAIGSDAASLNGKQVSYDPTRGTDGSLTFAVSAQASGFGLEWGTQLTPGNFPVANFLTGQNAGFEGGNGNWIPGNNDTIANTAAQAHSGSNSLQITSSAAGAMTVISCATVNITTQGFAVVPGQSVIVQGWFRSAVSARSCAIGADWYTSGGAFISTSYGSAAAVVALRDQVVSHALTLGVFDKVANHEPKNAPTTCR